MKRTNWLDEHHKYCEICGNRMAVVEHAGPSKYNRATGEEIKGETWRTWECPLFPTDQRHDREEC